LRYQLADGNDSDAGEQWPPQDPTAYNNHTFSLPANPWTYENGSLNPDLQPSNTSRLRERTSSKRVRPTSALPPYHPDYKESATDEEAESCDSDDEYWEQSAPQKLVRRGSEGYEVRPVDREEMLRQYVDEQTHMQGRYNVYEPEVDSESESVSDVDKRD